VDRGELYLAGLVTPRIHNSRHLCLRSHGESKLSKDEILNELIVLIRKSHQGAAEVNSCDLIVKDHDTAGLDFIDLIEELLANLKLELSQKGWKDILRLVPTETEVTFFWWRKKDISISELSNQIHSRVMLSDK